MNTEQTTGVSGITGFENEFQTGGIIGELLVKIFESIRHLFSLSISAKTKGLIQLLALLALFQFHGQRQLLGAHQVWKQRLFECHVIAAGLCSLLSSYILLAKANDQAASAICCKPIKKGEAICV